MVITMLFGGLGNQMFQFAVGKHLALARNCDMRVSTLLLDRQRHDLGYTHRKYNLDIFRVKIKSISTKRLPEYNPVLVQEQTQFAYNGKLIKQAVAIPRDRTILLKGYWQSHHYFDSFREEIRADFMARNRLRGKWKKLSRRIAESESVMVHIRRTDYLNKTDFYKVVSANYIMESMAYVKERKPAAVFYIFSDDLSWCRSNISDNNSEVVFVDDSYADKKCRSYFQLMRMCKNFITANSTFSWWAAYLGQNPESIVITPEKWFQENLDLKDLIPEKWVKIEF